MNDKMIFVMWVTGVSLVLLLWETLTLRYGIKQGYIDKRDRFFNQDNAPLGAALSALVVGAIVVVTGWWAGARIMFTSVGVLMITWGLGLVITGFREGIKEVRQERKNGKKT